MSVPDTGREAAGDAVSDAVSEAASAAASEAASEPGLTAGVVLVGPPTAGKTSIGALLARELGVPFADTDALVRSEERRVGKECLE